jgi:hypothetical protein
MRYYVLIFIRPEFTVQVTHLVQLTYYIRYISEISTISINAPCNSCEDSTFGICEDVRHFSQHSYNVTINSHNGQLTLHTNSHAGGKGNIARRIQITVQWNSSISETVRIGHMYIYASFSLEWPILWPPELLNFPPRTPCVTIHTQLIVNGSEEECALTQSVYVYQCENTDSGRAKVISLVAWAPRK